MLGLVATDAGGGSDSYTSLQAYCTSAGVGWAAGAGCGRSVAIVTEPYTQRKKGDWGRKVKLRRNGTDDTRVRFAAAEGWMARVQMQAGSGREMTSLSIRLALVTLEYQSVQLHAKAAIVPECRRSGARGLAR